MTDKTGLSQSEAIVMGGIIAGALFAVVAALFAGSSLLTASIFSALAVGLALGGLTLGGSARKPALGVALIGQCVVLTTALSGHPWQVDSHMVFFAALAILIVLRDIPTILAATGAIAVHHLSFSVAFPALVYPSVDLMENLSRTVFHAIIVLVEAAALCQAIARQNRLVASVEEKTKTVEHTLASESEANAARAQAHEEQRAAIAVLSDGLERLATGDLTQEIEAPMGAEFEALRANFNELVQRLRTIISEVSTSADAISKGSDGLSSASGQLAERTEQQAASLAETNQTITDLTTTVDGTVTNVRDAYNVVHDTKSLAEDGMKVVSKAVAAMGEIKTGSDEISQIILTIDDIAFQTNLLALNAGVEAARAGSAGQGFAVVAAEVGALAQRSGEAAKEIAALIASTQTRVKGGVDLTDQANQSLTAISEKISGLANSVSDINDTLQNQAQGLQNIGYTIGHLDSLTQQNAAMAEETSAASIDLKGDVAELQVSASNFKVISQNDRAKRVA
ncbi:MAG: methyl-accepting chemotaxis protein [Pseudomonadota bacterium]